MAICCFAVERFQRFLQDVRVGRRNSLVVVLHRVDDFEAESFVEFQRVIILYLDMPTKRGRRTEEKEEEERLRTSMNWVKNREEKGREKHLIGSGKS